MATVLFGGHRGDGPRPDRRPESPALAGSATGGPSRRLWVLCTALLGVLGVVGSVLGGSLWTSYQDTQNLRSFTRTASGFAASVAATIRRDLDFQAAVQALVATTPGLTNHALAPWLAALDPEARYPGTVGFGYVVPVAAADLSAFRATMSADPLVGYPSVPYAVFPPGERSQYCLARFGFVTSAEVIPPGIDLCAPEPLLIAGQLRQVADSGHRAVLVYGKAFNPAAAKSLGLTLSYLQRVVRGLFAIVTPVYAGDVAPPNAAARHRLFTGWLVGTFTAPKMLEATRRALPSTSLELRLGPNTVIDTVGSMTGGQRMAVTREVLSDPSVFLIVTAPATSGAVEQGVVLGALGVVVVLLLCGFLLHLVQARDRALRLVDQRTGELRHQALHDALTGLPNRDLLFDRAEQLLVRSHRYLLGVGALYIDLDNFKDVNDSYGHQLGDRLICAVAARLVSVLRASDTVGRLGGDEFLVLVEGDSFETGPERVAQRILHALAEPFELRDHRTVRFSVQASIGVATGVRASAEELVRDADVALYQAKAAGRNCYVVFRPEMQASVQHRLELQMDLRLAVERGQLYVVYQPIFDLGSLRPKGVEALVRWRHPQRGVLAPDDFIPLAEESGLIVGLGEFVLSCACEQGARWREQGMAIDMWVNISVTELEARGFVDRVAAALSRGGLEPRHLTLEITESTLMHDSSRNLDILTRLKELGVRIAIDDFGTGYSSLAYLRQFPIDALKIDRSFIARATQTAESGALVHTLIQLGAALGIETLAEGIEEQSQLDRLQFERCDSGQGFLFARPLEAAELEAFLARRPPTTSTSAR